MKVTAQNKEAKQMKSKGRFGDTEMAHVAQGEIVIPQSVQTPLVLAMLEEAFEEQGIPMERYMVGSNEQKNPETGEDEYFDIGGMFKTVLPIAGTVIGGMVGGPAGAAIGGGLAGSLAGGGEQPQQSAGGQTQPSMPTSGNGGNKDYFPEISYQSFQSNSAPSQQSSSPMSSQQVLGGNMPSNNLFNVMPTNKSFNPYTGRQEFYDANAIQPSGLTQAANQAAKRAAGYTGGFTDPNEFKTWAAANPAGAAAYNAAGAAASPNFKSPIAPTPAPAPVAAAPSPQPAATSTPTAPSKAIQPSGLAQDINRQLKEAAGYTGGYSDPQEFQTWAAANPEGYLKYVQAGAAASPNFKNPVDVDPLTPGQQGVNKAVNQYLGSSTGLWTGDTGTGQLGSGKNGVDILTVTPNQQAKDQYLNTRKLLEPGYVYNERDVLPSDFNAEQYLKNNPQAAAAVQAGNEYTTAGHHYLTSGQGSGLQYTTPADDKPDWYKEIKDQLDSYQNQQNNNNSSQSNANQNSTNFNQLSPVRNPRFRSKRFTGSYASAF